MTLAAWLENETNMDKRAPLIPGYAKIIDKLVDIALAAGPVASQTDNAATKDQIHGLVKSVFIGRCLCCPSGSK